MEVTAKTGPDFRSRHPTPESTVLREAPSDLVGTGDPDAGRAAPSTGRTLAVLVLGDAIAGLGVLVALQVLVRWAGSGAVSVFTPTVGIGLVGGLALFAVTGSYRPRFVHPATIARRTAGSLFTITGAATGTSLLLSGASQTTALVLVGGLLAIGVVPLVRLMIRVLGARCSWWGFPAVVVSLGPGGEEVVDTLTRWPEMGLRPVSVVGLNGNDRGDGAATGTHAPHRAIRLARQWRSPCAVLWMPDGSHDRRAKVLTHYARFFDSVIHVTPSDAPAFWTTGDRGSNLRGYAVDNAATSQLAERRKRLLDLVLASSILLLLAPMFAAIALLISLDSDGPVFYRQERLGEGGETFTLLKFRTMFEDADERLEEVLNADPELRREYETYHKLQDDPRVTPVGNVLREWSLDELPQLINVVRGEMSLVGPRAYMPGELPRMKGLDRVILRTPPGVTGLWQVSGRNNLSFSDRVDLDVHYVQNWSFALDLYLLARTIPTVVTGEGAA
jgi:Undecaprenyl-phosphate galactose phosphotransferase WbaP